MHAEMFSSCLSNWSILWIFQRHSPPLSVSSVTDSSKVLNSALEKLPPTVGPAPLFRGHRRSVPFTEGTTVLHLQLGYQEDALLLEMQNGWRQSSGFVQRRSKARFYQCFLWHGECLEVCNPVEPRKAGQPESPLFSSDSWTEIFSFSTKRNMKRWCFRHDRSAKRSLLVIQEWQAV